MRRVVEPELLDQLAGGDPRAIHSRRDLRILNRLMGNASIIAGALSGHPKPGRVLDLGAGDGALSLALARKLRWNDTELVLVDRNGALSDSVRDAFAACQCPVTLRCCDVLAGFGPEKADLIFANLFLHHFEELELRELFAQIAKSCTFFVACDPRRTAMSFLASRCVGLLGCNYVTRHDAVLSVRAGFHGDELSRLWPNGNQWSFRERASGLFSHLFVARKL
jgi:SAM-dependent methyltransferase